MYLLITVGLIALFLFGVIFEYISTLRQRNQNDKNRKIVKLQNILAKSQRLLNGRTLLPLTVRSSIVCLQRSHLAVSGLIELEPTENRLDALKDIDKKLNNFNGLEQTNAFFYALQTVSTTADEQARMLKQAMVLVILLKVEHGRGRLSVEELHGEVNPLEILIARLKSCLYSAQAMQQLELKVYDKAQALSDKSMEMLTEISTDNQEVNLLVEEEMAKLSLVNDGITGVIDEKSHAFYDKFKGQGNSQNNTEDGAKKKSTLFDHDDGLGSMFGKKRKY